MVEVKNGLLSGETIVVSGQFMLDSESKTQEAIQKMIRAKMEVALNTEVHTHPVSETKEEAELHEHTPGEVENLNVTPEKKADFAEEVYTCPMVEHSHILQVGPGKCPECEMDLFPITETGRDVYTCPMEEHHYVLSNVPGTCPECGMNLTKLKPKDQDAGKKRSK